ncbi:MAG: N-6 DNA methylase [Prevotella sp.]|nr:N-6 DNA methylase [Prevotella sp.]
MGREYYQKPLFDDMLTMERQLQNNDNEVVVNLSSPIVSKLKNYSLEYYVKDIETHGLKYTWDYICEYVLTYGENRAFLNIHNFGEMYEIGLAIQDKQQKKKNGQYYTPDDVALIMSEWFDSLEGQNLCDVGCGTGKLILTYLDYIGKERAIKLLKEGKVYLYDIDSVALKICKTALLLKYGKELNDVIHDIEGDFLSSNIKLPHNCKVISNPPYAAIQQVGLYWKNTMVLNDSRELYSIFMEKIINDSLSSIIITPYSFISGSKFYSLRRILNQYNGEIFSFDNVPGNIFCGRKHGIFNTNTSNSVRAAITIVRKNNSDGFRLTPLIRFKSTERKALLQCKTLENFLSPKKQKISSDMPMYYKCFKELQPLYDCMIEKARHHILAELVSKSGKYTLSMPNTCRYFTSAISGKMNRSGQITLHFDDEKKFNYIYCLINSSFAYWHWRLFDGGITYPVSLLLKMPIFYESLTEEDHLFLKDIVKEMSSKADDYIVKKNNVGIQENIKYPRQYRDRINQRFLKILNLKVDNSTMDLIHSNMALKISV